MAKIKIVSIAKRVVTVNVVWDDGLTRTLDIPNVPVEDFDQSHAMMTEYIASQYEAALKEKQQQAYNNPTPDPRVTAAIGHTFDNDGNVVA